MALKTFTIEIRVDFDDPKKNDTMKVQARKAAYLLLTNALLLQDSKRVPKVSLQSGDMFESDTEIMLSGGDVEDEVFEEGTPEAVEGARTQNANIARVAGYTVGELKGKGWRFNNADGAWSEQFFPTESAAWEAAYTDIPTYGART